MWLQHYILIISFLYSLVLGKPTRQAVKFPHTLMNLECDKAFYSGEDLSYAAFDACSRYDREVNCRDYSLCDLRSIFMSKVPKYDGYLFPDQHQFPLLKWPLPRRTRWRGAKNYVIVEFSPSSRSCNVVMAIMIVKRREKEYTKCTAVSWEQNVGVSRENLSQRQDETHTFIVDDRMNP